MDLDFSFSHKKETNPAIFMLRRVMQEVKSGYCQILLRRIIYTDLQFQREEKSMKFYRKIINL